MRPSGGGGAVGEAVIPVAVGLHCALASPRLRSSPVMTALMTDAVPPKPSLMNSTGAQNIIMLIPLSCWNSAITTAITSWG